MKILEIVAESRFALVDDNEDNHEVGEMTWVDRGEYFIINHTFVEPEYNGHGYAGQLVKAGVEKARREKRIIVPTYPFALHKFFVTAEYADVWQKEENEKI